MSRVLVVDDEPVVRELLGQVLEEEGRVVVHAASGSEALEAAAAGGPLDVALVDKNLPDGSGLKLARALKSADPATEVILMTAYPSLDSAIEAVEVGASDYLPKPFDDIRQVAIRVGNAAEQAILRRERESLHHALRESEERYRKLFEASPDAVIVYEETSRIIREVNSAAVALYGHKREDLIGRSVDSLSYTPDVPIRSSVPEGLEHPLEGADGAIERRDVRADGEAVTVEVSSGQFWIAGRAMVVDVVRDITARLHDEAERIRLETELRQAQKMEALGQLAGGIAHDFNNLLAVILNYAKFVSEAVDELPTSSRSSEMLEDVEQILQAATSAAAITRQLLAFSRKEVINPEVLDVNQVLAGVEKIVTRTLGESVLLETDLASDVWRVKLDRGQLEQVVVNLAVNARDAMPSGGKLRIATRNVPNDRNGERLVSLEVADTGSGMSEDTVKRIFDPFFTTKGEGTGLGLATVKGIVEQAGGTIAVTSALRKGTTFSILFPVTDEPEATSDYPREEVSACRGETVLVVDDDDAVRRAVCRILAGAGYGVLEARTGTEALVVHARQGAALDLLLTDVVMPGMSGRELAREMGLRQPGLRVIFMTGYATQAVLASAQMPNRALLPKPFRDARLLDLMRDVLDASEAERG